MDENTKKINWIQLISYVLIVFLTIVCTLLIIHNRDLKRNALTSIGQFEPLEPGERVEPFSVQTLDGNTTVIDYSNPAKGYLFFVLSTTCPHCERTLPHWQSIADSKSENFDVLGISIHNIDETRNFLASKSVGFYTVSVLNDTSFNRKYKINGVPATFLVNGEGVVEKVWVGALNDEQTSEIQDLMIASKAVTKQQIQ